MKRGRPRQVLEVQMSVRMVPLADEYAVEAWFAALDWLLKEEPVAPADCAGVVGDALSTSQIQSSTDPRSVRTILVDPPTETGD